MNEKLIKLVHDEGFCCMWAFLEANKATYTSELLQKAKAIGLSLTARAIRHQRRKWRKGKIICLQKENCLTARLKEARKTP